MLEELDKEVKKDDRSIEKCRSFNPLAVVVIRQLAELRPEGYASDSRVNMMKQNRILYNLNCDNIHMIIDPGCGVAVLKVRTIFCDGVMFSEANNFDGKEP